MNAHYFEISSAINTNVRNLFSSMVCQLVDNIHGAREEQEDFEDEGPMAPVSSAFKIEPIAELP
jgi:hypothetical protein